MNNQPLSSSLKTSGRIAGGWPTVQQLNSLLRIILHFEELSIYYNILNQEKKYSNGGKGVAISHNSLKQV